MPCCVPSIRGRAVSKTNFLFQWSLNLMNSYIPFLAGYSTKNKLKLSKEREGRGRHAAIQRAMDKWGRALSVEVTAEMQRP